MINLFIAPNGWGKTHTLNEEYHKVEGEGKLAIFFPAASELGSLWSGESNSNLLGPDGTARKTTYKNPISIILNKIFGEISVGDQEKINMDSISNTLKEQIKEFNEKANVLFEQIKPGQNESNLYTNEIYKNKIEKEMKDMESFDVAYSVKDNKPSHGQLHFYGILECLRLIKKFKSLPSISKIVLFFDELESYFHPDFIKKIIVKLLDVDNSLPNIQIYLTSHSPLLIKMLLNESISKKNTVNILVKDKIDANFEPHKFNNCFCSMQQILYEIYGIYSIEFLDELIGRINFWNQEDQSKYPIRFSFNEKTPISNGVIPLPTEHVYIDPLKHCTYRNKSIISFVRNYFHHPESRVYPQSYTRSNNEESYSEYLLNKNLILDDLLKKAIGNCIDILSGWSKFDSILN
ncbi:MAG: AAA family ATPase [Mycoplasmoidaceae bacterium]